MLARRFGTMIVAALAIGLSVSAAQAQTHTSKPFTGAKVNAGTVTHSTMNGQHVLTLSDDFKVPDTPDPHWQVIDGNGRVYLLQRLGVKNGIGLTGDRINKSITLPAFIADVAKVQIYCAWAEAVLGETSFERTLTTTSK
jgi:hypothetical protein